MSGPDRLYGLAIASDGLFDSPAGVYEADIEPYLGFLLERQSPAMAIDEWTVHPPSYHLPTADAVAEHVYEHACDMEMSEDCDEEYRRVSQDPDVLAAFQSALDLMASKVTYRMADKLVATHTLTWTADGAPLLDGEPLSHAAGAVNGACDFFRWVGQPVTSCDECGRPAWDHAYRNATRHPWSEVLIDAWVRNGWITEERAAQLRAVQPGPPVQP
jgi:hypothetical protein